MEPQIRHMCPVTSFLLVRVCGILYNADAMNSTFSMLVGCLLCGMGLAQQPTPDDLFYRKSFVVSFPVDSVQFEDKAMRMYRHGSAVKWIMGFIDKHYTLKEIKNCSMVDAAGRNLQASAVYDRGYQITVSARKNLYAQGDWVDVQGVAVVSPHASPCQETVVFPGTQSGTLPLKHGSFSWKIRTDDDGAQSYSFSAGQGVSRLQSIGYTDAAGDWVEIEDIDENTAYSLWTPIPQGTVLTIQYCTAGEETEVPFRYRLSMSGAELLPYLPEVQTTDAAPIEKAPAQLCRAEHPVTITPASFYWREEDTCTLQLDARLFSDTHTVANARLKNLRVKDAKGKLLDTDMPKVDTDADSVQADISFAVPATPSVTVSGVLELDAGDIASRLISVMVPCTDGTTFSVAGLEGKVVPASANEHREMMDNISGRMRVEGKVQVVQICLENVPESLREDDVVITGDKGQSFLVQSVSSHFTPLSTTRDIVYRKSVTYTLAFDGPLSQLKVSVDSRKSAPTRTFPFSFRLNISGAE